MAKAKGAPKTGGRQKGVPNKATAEIKEFARRYGPKAIEELAILGGLLERDGRAAAEQDTARIAACKEVLDRAYGKAAQTVAGDPENPLHLKTRVEFVIVDHKG